MYRYYTLVYIFLIPLCLFSQDDGLDWAVAIPMEFPEVAGIEVNTLGESGELQLDGAFLYSDETPLIGLEAEYSFTHWFSLEGEVLAAFQDPYLPEVELNSSFSMLRDELKGLLLVGGLELGASFQEQGEIELEPWLGFYKTFKSFAVLSNASVGLGFEMEESESAEDEEGIELEVTSGIGPYVPFGKTVLIGIPTSFLREEGENSLFTGLEFDLIFPEELKFLMVTQYSVVAEEYGPSLSIGISKSFE
ncbi:hypothetical protein ACFL5V_09950 [Fibrobacterota bacterium]